MPASRRHHVLPRFYLERFADSSHQLTQVWLPGDRSHPISVNDASVITDFYNITSDDGAVDDFWEQQFSALEGVAADAFREVVDDRVWPPSEDSRTALSYWVALQYLRSASIRDSIADQNALIIKIQTGTSGIERLRSVMQAGLGRKVGDVELEAEWEDLTQVGGTRIVIPAATHIKFLTDLISPTAHLLYDSGWVVVRFDRKRLITSDSPVALRPRDGSSPHMGVGLATAGSYMVALSRFDGLMIVVSDPGDVSQTGTTRIANLFNFDTSNNARKYVLHHPEDADMLAAIPLHDSIDREVADQGNEHFVDREGWAAKFRRNDTPSFGQADQGNAIPHYSWPIPGRTFQNPHYPVGG